MWFEIILIVLVVLILVMLLVIFKFMVAVFAPTPLVSQDILVIIKTDIKGKTQQVARSSNYIKLVKEMDKMTEEYENQGIFLLHKNVSNNLVRSYQFASKERGWEFVLILTYAR